MIHYGDIKTLSGSTLPPVDVIIGGSPCQDLSVAEPFWTPLRDMPLPWLPPFWKGTR